MTTQIEIDAKNFAKGVRAVLAVADELVKVGSLEQATAYAEKKLGEARANTTQADAKYQEAQDRLETVDDEVVKAKEKAANVLFVANQEAKLMLDDASHDIAIDLKNAKQTVENARDEVDNYHKHVHTEHEKHKAAMIEYKYAETAAKVAVDTIKQELEDLRARIG